MSQLLRNLASRVNKRQFTTIKQTGNKIDNSWVKLLGVKSVNNGKDIEIEFNDNSKYLFHSGWIKDSMPSNIGLDQYRIDPMEVFEFHQFNIHNIEIIDDGNNLLVEIEKNHKKLISDTFPTQWLYEYAPYVAKYENNNGKDLRAATCTDTGSLLDNIYSKRKPWNKNSLNLPVFDANELINNYKNQIIFCEAMVDPGICVIKDVEKYHDVDEFINNIGYNNIDIGVSLEKFIKNIFGKLNQHPIRNTNYLTMVSTNIKSDNRSDYDQGKDLLMHTDHTLYSATPGYVQCMYQLKGDVITKICDGLECANYMKQHYPNKYKLLTDINITHASNNILYTSQGDPRSNLKHDDDDDENNNVYPFGLVHTHPIIKIDEKDGSIEKIAHNEQKRGTFSIPYDKYDEYMDAYIQWCNILQKDEFIYKVNWVENSIIVINNWRVLHGRGVSVPVNSDRVMVMGYINKGIFENRYRYLKQLEYKDKYPNINELFLSKIPNQILNNLCL